MSSRSARGARRLALPLSLLLSLAAADAGAKTWFVTVGGQGLTFSPQTLDIQTGDTVTFLNLGGFHNVVADDGTFRCAQGCDNDGHGGSGAVSNQPWQVSIPFAKSGRIGYFCEAHGAPGVGMFGTINVAAAPPPPPLEPSAVPLGKGALAALLLALLAGATRRLRRHRR